MRARLAQMAVGAQYSFICQSELAERIERVIRLAAGEIVNRDEHRYGVIITVRKCQS